VNSDSARVSTNVFAAGVQWLQATLSGTLATAVAVIAVAAVGLLLLSGRIDVRRGAQVIFGCFVLFGASSIAAGIVRAASGENASPDIAATLPPPPVYPPPTANASVPAVPYDPYAGAALPTRH
jgi:type IV secretory pathway VirB2 component (pilin)